jgi:hypothetical protein
MATIVITRNDDDGEYSGQEVIKMVPPDMPANIVVQDPESPGSNRVQADFVDDSIRYDVRLLDEGEENA